jgi:cardiolipin synthase (CMP-forming)
VYVVSLRRLPDAITASRFVSSAVIAAGGVMHNRGVVVGALACALLSDLLDGPIARSVGQAGEHGARLDSRADFAVLCVAPASIYSVFPTGDDRFRTIVSLVYLSYAVPILIGGIKFRRLTSYHTWGARAAAVALPLGLGVFLAWRIILPLEVAVAVLIASAIEEIGITLLIPHWRADVRSLSTAVRILHARRATGAPQSSS